MRESPSSTAISSTDFRIVSLTSAAPLLDWEDRGVAPHHFGKLCELQDDDGHRVEAVLSTLAPERREEALAYICDELCKHREGRTQEELNTICESCKAGRWAADPPTLTPQEVRELRNTIP